jgi:hypothetical protein
MDLLDLVRIAIAVAVGVGLFGGAVYLGLQLSYGGFGRRLGRAVEAERAQRVRASGPRLAQGKPVIRIGDLRAPGPEPSDARGFSVSVYPGGILVSVKFVGSHAILTEEIRRVSKTSINFRDALMVEHDGVGMGTPVVFSPSGLFSGYGRVAAAIVSLPITPRPAAAPEPAAPAAAPDQVTKVRI